MLSRQVRASYYRTLVQTLNLLAADGLWDARQAAAAANGCAHYLTRQGVPGGFALTAWLDEIAQVAGLAAAEVLAEPLCVRLAPEVVTALVRRRVRAAVQRSHRRYNAHGRRTGRALSTQLEPIADPTCKSALQVDLQASLARLTPGHRQVLEDILRGYTEEELAVRYEISHQAVSKRKLAAQRELKRILGDDYLEW